jgi:ABC-type cobalamin/Fe3+-siderophores transport system ATPase subunit
MKTLKTFEKFINESIDAIKVDSQELLDSLESYYNNHRQPTLVLGPVGSGKSFTIKEFAKTNNLTINEINASHLSIDEFENVDIRKDDVIVFEDINRATKLVFDKIAEFTFNNKESFIIWTAVDKNNISDSSINRLAIIELE